MRSRSTSPRWRTETAADAWQYLQRSTGRPAARRRPADGTTAVLLGEAALGPSSLCLEVTETALLEDLEASMVGLLGLRMLRVHVAVDDFGTGSIRRSCTGTGSVDVV